MTVSLRPRPHDPRRVRGVVFDLDGTLVDSFGALAAAANAARAALALPPLSVPEVRRHVGHGMEALVRGIAGADRAERALPLFLDAYDRVCEDETTAVPGASRTLAALRERGYRMTVASNKLARFSNRILARVGLAAWLDAVEGPDTAGAVKPHPAMIDRAIAAMGCGRDETVYVGDMALDAESAARAGVTAILVAVPGGDAIAELERTGATVVDRLEAILDFLPPVNAGS